MCLGVDESDFVGVMVTFTFYLKEQENSTRQHCCDFSLTIKCLQTIILKAFTDFLLLILHGLTWIEWSNRSNLLKGIWMNLNL